MKFKQKLRLRLYGANPQSYNFDATQTKQGTLYHDGNDVNVGDDVFIDDENGERIPAPSGRYENTNNETVYIVEAGVVVDIVSPSQENMSAEDAAEEIPPESDSDVITREEFNALRDTVMELIRTLADTGGNEELSEEIQTELSEKAADIAMKKVMAKLSSQSVDKPATHKDKRQTDDRSSIKLGSQYSEREKAYLCIK